MTSRIITKGILQAIAVLALVAAVLFFLYEIQTVLIYIIVALVTTLIGNPIVDFLKTRLRFQHTLATSVTLLLFVLVIVGLVLLFVPLILDQGQNLSLLNTAAIEKSFLELLAQITTFLESHGIDARRIFREAGSTSKINFNFIPTFFNVILGTVSNIGMGLASVLFITFFFLKDRLLWVAEAKKLIPDNHEEKILNSINKINHLLSRYFIGILIQLSIVFLLYLIVLLIFGIENAIVIAFLCAILNIVPYIGPLIASILAAILTMIGNLGCDFQNIILPTTLYVLLGFWVVQIIDNNFCQPMIFSKSVSSHPLEVFLVTIMAGFLFGILGMIIAVPFYTILKVIGKEFFPENVVIQLLTKNI